MPIVIDCFTGFYQEKGEAAVCGIVLSRDGVKQPYFKYRPKGDYLNGLLELLIECIEAMVPRLDGSVLHLDVHIHHKNSNFKKALDKARMAGDTARGYGGNVRANIIKHTLIRKGYHKPVSYEKMTQMALVLVKSNSPDYRVTVATCGDSRSRDQLAVYTACQGRWNDLKATAAVAEVQAPVTESSSAN